MRRCKSYTLNEEKRLRDVRQAHPTVSWALVRNLYNSEIADPRRRRTASALRSKWRSMYNHENKLMYRRARAQSNPLEPTQKGSNSVLFRPGTENACDENVDMGSILNSPKDHPGTYVSVVPRNSFELTNSTLAGRSLSGPDFPADIKFPGDTDYSHMGFLE